MKRNRLLFLLALLMTAATGAWAQSTTTHKVTMKSGTKDAANWTISDGTTTATGAEGLDGVAEDATVKLTYTGRLKVKSVTAELVWNGNLSNIPASALESDGYTVIVPDGTTLTGTLDVSTTPYKIEIPDGATVTLAGVTIEGTNVDDPAYWHAGISCEGDATIILKDGTTNTVKGFLSDYPGIQAGPSGTKLTIKGGSLGTGILNASPFDGGTDNSYGAGIGADPVYGCGDIDIQGGVITATGGYNAAGIGSANSISCDNITISGGTLTATGGMSAAGIGSGCMGGCENINISGGTVEAIGGENAAAIGCGNSCSSCGAITITSGVTLVTATKGKGAFNSIGRSENNSSCGTVLIGCELDASGNPVSGTGTVYYDGADYQNGGDRYLTQATITYPNIVNLSELTGDVTATYGATLTGTLDGETQPYKITIADGATVTLDGATINGWYGMTTDTYWAGLTCAGDATIILKDGSANTVKGFQNNYPGIYVPEGKTLTIQGGTGSLNASCNNDGCNAAGIGGGYDIACGNIEIQGGVITATGGSCAAGIGSCNKSCGTITISGGTVEATGGIYSPGIGSGYKGSCAGITIANTVTKVWATMGNHAPNSVGAGKDGSCGTVTIGGTVYWNGVNYVNEGDAYLSQMILMYPTITVGGIVLIGKEGQSWSFIVANNPGMLKIDGDYIKRKSSNLMLTIPDLGYVYSSWTYDSSITYLWQ